MKRTGIGDSPRMTDYTVNDRKYRVIKAPNDDEEHVLVWRLTERGEPDGIAGHISKINASHWKVVGKPERWVSKEQAVVEVAKADQGVSYAR